MTSVTDLIAAIERDDEDDDGTAAWEAARRLGAEGSPELMPELRVHLALYLDAGNFWARDMVAEAMAGVAGTGALLDLLRAAARDLGDDQDGLWGAIADLITRDPVGCRKIIDPLRVSVNPRARAVAHAAERFFHGLT